MTLAILYCRGLEGDFAISGSFVVDGPTALRDRIKATLTEKEIVLDWSDGMFTASLSTSSLLNWIEACGWRLEAQSFATTDSEDTQMFAFRKQIVEGKRD